MEPGHLNYVPVTLSRRVLEPPTVETMARFR